MTRAIGGRSMVPGGKFGPVRIPMQVVRHEPVEEQHRWPVGVAAVLDVELIGRLRHFGRRG